MTRTSAFTATKKGKNPRSRPQKLGVPLLKRRCECTIVRRAATIEKDFAPDGHQLKRDMEANLQIGPTDQGFVRIFIEASGVEIPMDFDPEEAEEIAKEITRQRRRRVNFPNNQLSSGKGAKRGSR